VALAVPRCIWLHGARGFPIVLGQLAKTLHFELSFESKSGPLINADAWIPPNQLLARLVPDASISATEAIRPSLPASAADP
jgi:hypothetical protein